MAKTKLVGQKQLKKLKKNPTNEIPKKQLLLFKKPIKREKKAESAAAPVPVSQSKLKKKNFLKAKKEKANSKKNGGKKIEKRSDGFDDKIAFGFQVDAPPNLTKTPKLKNLQSNTKNSSLQLNKKPDISNKSAPTATGKSKQDPSPVELLFNSRKKEERKLSLIDKQKKALARIKAIQSYRDLQNEKRSKKALNSSPD